MSVRHAGFASCLAALALPVLLAGCGGGDSMARSFGLVREGPDEFRVTTRAPLSIPPEFNLPPPRPGAPRPQETSTTQQAAAVLAPEATLDGEAPAPAAGTPSTGQSALVSAAGRGAPDQSGIAAPSRSLTDRLMFWNGGAPSSDAVIDPDREAQRLR
ncbi:DUF3035 domain-containing protein, partial [Acidisphaera rubrifaciens]|uniref:DUF3035 domain-containing protein n=1 Tax=Acidisphaera rubrifaciens TaxID=50715 RepID=UPI000662297A